MLHNCGKNAKIQKSSQETNFFRSWIIQLPKKHVFQHVNLDKLDVVNCLSWFFDSLRSLIVHFALEFPENWYHHVSYHTEGKQDKATYESLPSCNKEQTSHRKEQAVKLEDSICINLNVFDYFGAVKLCQFCLFACRHSILCVLHLLKRFLCQGVAKTTENLASDSLQVIGRVHREEISHEL